MYYFSCIFSTVKRVSIL